MEQWGPLRVVAPKENAMYIPASSNRWLRSNAISMAEYQQHWKLEHMA